MNNGNNTVFSISPSGEEFPLPQNKEYDAEFNRIENLLA